MKLFIVLSVFVLLLATVPGKGGVAEVSPLPKEEDVGQLGSASMGEGPPDNGFPPLNFHDGPTSQGSSRLKPVY
ncbi:hypothetical protein L596_008752 [Steinernema carpocapsae]|uniref:Secreted protein n=1 Tax=Steinernema carpocapsae TaxID=34508 RepID=A0A4U5PDQ3_STECR|nr:hypothetical protein L596_008752 [Steinernema carpocapsae]